MTSDTTYAPRLDRATQRALSGDVEGAVTDLRDLVAESPDEDAAWLTLGMVLSAAGRWREACEALAEAVALDGDVLSARLAYARALEKAGKLDDAAFHLLKAQKLAPDDPHPLKELGAVFYKKGLYDKSIQFLGRARGLAPDDARIWYAIGLAQEARRDPGATIAAYREAIRLDPGWPDPKKTLADTLAAMGEHEQAIAVLDDLLRIERTNEQAAQNRDVLAKALEELSAHRLLGKTEREIDKSALVQEGQLKRKGRIEGALVGKESDGSGGGFAESRTTLRYVNNACEMLAHFAEDGTVSALLLALDNPEKAAKKRDSVFQVTVVNKSGRREPADLATGLTLTFLREALGAPMTEASELYARLLANPRTPVSWSGARIRFATVPRPDRPDEPYNGLLVETADHG